MIPCKQQRCLKFPICKSRAIIDCNVLKEYYLVGCGDREGAELLDRVNDIWIDIHKHLPSVTVINSESSVIQAPVLYKIRRFQ